MTQSYSRSTQLNHGQLNRSQLNRICSDTDQAFSDVIAAISEGKYSWACVLMLRSAGYNPLHYMPYRTYNRIIKANLNLGNARTTSNRSQTSSKDSSKGNPKGIAPNRSTHNGSTHNASTNNVTNGCPTRHGSNHSVNHLTPSDIADLPHLESVQDGEKDSVIGGHGHTGCSLIEDASVRETSTHAWWSTLMHRIRR